jgi:hypothetical protein
LKIKGFRRFRREKDTGFEGKFSNTVSFFILYRNNEEYLLHFEQVLKRVTLTESGQ